ncbi:MAG: type IV toxin-antitoxin system AbiEi family antitoxin domain-containing protein [Propionibacteriaceae bacterium]|jgi:predicted transcriptional regulator of viral defense system|nr:type IV toxin-antitoxin system AbiEi family antitoxin domain-containing protein [Propionibacteriaceae bacterium]
MTVVLTDLDRLREVAFQQHGFVTTGQALESNVSHASLSMMVRRGRLERAGHGLYRVPQVPVTQYDEFQRAVLWTGFPEACLSHDTALDAWGISDINPNDIHVTVAAKRRITREVPQYYVIHKQDLSQEQVTWWEGIPIVTATEAVEQCIKSGVQTYLIRQALERAPRTGIIPKQELVRLAKLLETRGVSRKRWVGERGLVHEL